VAQSTSAVPRFTGPDRDGRAGAPDDHAADVTSISLRRPSDLLATLPYQLGYHPQDSVVVVAVHGGRVAFIQRLDLPAEDRVPEAVDTMLPALVRQQPDAVLLVGYEDAEHASRPVLDALEAACVESGITVWDQWVVRDGRWFAPRQADRGGPPDGTILPRPHEVPAVADFVAMERAALPSRAAVGAQLGPDLGLQSAVSKECRRLAPSPRRRSGKGAPRPAVVPSSVSGLQAPPHDHALRVWARVCDVGSVSAPVEALSAAEVATLVLSLRDVHLRDAVIAWTCPGAMPLACLPSALATEVARLLPAPAWARAGRSATSGSDPGPLEREATIAGHRFQARLQWLCRATPRRDLPAMLTVLANFAWWSGDGGIARMALERALAIDPGYRLAVLLEQMLSLALRPSATR
jgi:hypothetical protein